MKFPNFSDLAPGLAAMIIGGLFAFHSVPAVAEEAESAPQAQEGRSLAEILAQSRPMENCTAFTQRILDRKYGADFIPPTYAKETCACLQEGAAGEIEKLDIPNEALRNTLLTLVIDTELLPQLGKEESELLRAIVDFVIDDKDAENIGFTAAEWEAALETVNASKTFNKEPFDWNNIRQFQNDYPICYNLAQVETRHWLNGREDITPETNLALRKARAIRAIEHDQGTQLEDIDAILNSASPMDYCKQYGFSYQLRRHPDDVVSKIENEVADVCREWLDALYGGNLAGTPETIISYFTKSYVAIIYVGAYGTTADKDDVKDYFASQHAAFDLSPEEYADMLADIEENYSTPFDDQEKPKKAKYTPPYCPADMEYNYAEADVPAALNKTYLL